MYLLYPPGVDHSSPFAGIGVSLMIVMFGAVLTGIVIKLVIWSLNDTVSTHPANGAPDAMPVALFATGAFAGLFAVYAIALVASAFHPAWLVHVAAAVLVLLLAVLSPRLAGKASARVFAFAFRWSALVILGGVAVWIWLRSGDVITAAEALTGGKAYCIQVASGNRRDDFVAAETRFDFSPLTMRARCSQGWCWQNHAILVLADGETPSLWNWSYRKKSFLQEVLNVRTHPPAVVCQPKPNFARSSRLF
jgi:hypothetical protein